VDRDLQVKLKIDRSQAQQAIQAQSSELAEMKKRALDHYLQISKATKDLSNDTEVLGKKSKGAFDGINASSLLAAGGLLKMVGVLKDAGAAMQEAHDKARQMTSNFDAMRDKLRELSIITGNKLDDAFVQANQRFNVTARMTPEEGLAFRTGYQNSGAQYKGRTMSDKEFNQLELQAAKLTNINGISGSIGGDFFGGVAGLFDYRKFGNKAAEQALGVGNQSFQILQRGRGLTGKNVEELTKINAALFSQDAKLGITSDPSQNAAMVSLAAEFNANESALPIIDLMGQLRNKGTKAEPLVRSAGLKGNEDPITMIKALTPILVKEMNANNEDLDQTVGRYFEERSARLMTTMVNKGVIGGGFDDRLAHGSKYAGPAPAIDAIKEFNASPTGMARQAEAQKVQTEMMCGESLSKVELLRKTAENNLRNQGEIDTPQAAGRDSISSKMPWNWTYDVRQQRIDKEAKRMIQQAVPQSVLDGQLDPETATRAKQPFQSWTPGTEADMMRQMVVAGERGGIDVLAQALKETTQSLKDNTRAMEAERVVTPRPVPRAPNPGRR